MATTSLRVYHDHLGDGLPVIASSAAAGFPASNLESGNLQRYWVALNSAAQFLGYDAGVSLTTSPNALVLPDAAYLVSIGASVDLRWSDDGTSAGTSVGALTNGQPTFPWTPITAGHLAAPDARHAVAEWTGFAKRGWYVHLYGAMTAAPRLSGSWFLGVRTVLPTSPAMPGRSFGAARPHRGRDLILSWPAMPFASARVLADLIAALTPDAAEGFIETVAGVGYGGRGAWLYDLTGRTFNAATGLPWVLPVLCTTPAQALTTAVAPNLETGPVTVGWRERR